MSSGYINYLGADILIQNDLLDETAAVKTLNNFLLDEAALTPQIFFDTIVPTAPLVGMARFYEVIDVRIFDVTDIRIFDV